MQTPPLEDEREPPPLPSEAADYFKRRHEIMRAEREVAAREREARQKKSVLGRLRGAMANRRRRWRYD
jgi:hypothetical protein